MLTLYRAFYLSKQGKPRGMTFAAPSAEQAAKVAENWQLPQDTLLTVKAVRPLQPELRLTG